MIEVEYLTDSGGQPKAVVVPIGLWRRLLPKDDVTETTLVEAVEDYCLGQAMDEGLQTPLLRREEALAFLGEDKE